jgi:uncharacterized membrane protein YedE/YeeE
VSDEKKPDAPASGETSIRRSGSSRSSRRSKKKKKNQLPFGVGAFVLVLLVAFLLGRKSEMLAFFWITGIAFGYILQRARFCFTAAMRDPMLTGGTNLSKAVLIAFAFTSIGFIAIKYGAHIKGLPIPGQSYVVPVSFATVIGAFMFGIGMVIAGGCASGTLMRVGEGFLMQVLSLAFFVVGSLWGAHDFGWWKLNVIMKGKAVFLPDIFGWFGAVVVQLLIIVLLWIVADKWAKHKNA